MKTKKQNAGFLHVGRKLMHWYSHHGRDLPFRKTRDPYQIWICEIIFQQTRIQQGLQHYKRFISRFPDVATLAQADADEVLLYWKGLGYYSRAINLHKAAQQIITKHAGIFPSGHADILALPGIGKYTAAAISSICFGEMRPAVDGNLYRVLSRIFADDFDISAGQAFTYFSALALPLIPEDEAGTFNQAMMDLGSEICTPRLPKCDICPLQDHCLAYEFGTVQNFPVKSKKTKSTDLQLSYYFVAQKGQFLVRRRGADFIWKNLYEFPQTIPSDFSPYIIGEKTVQHKLTHKNLTIHFKEVELPENHSLMDFAAAHDYIVMTSVEAAEKSFPKPLQNYLDEIFPADNAASPNA